VVSVAQPLAQVEAQEMQTRWHPQGFVQQVPAAALVPAELDLMVAQVAQVDSPLLEVEQEEPLHLHQERQVQVEQGLLG
jgi:hypothetical protein